MNLTEYLGSKPRHLEHLGILFSLIVPILICTLLVSLRHRWSPLFTSDQNTWTEWWIEDCRYRAVLDNPEPGNPRTEGQSFSLDGNGIDENALCSTFLRCILSQATPDYPTYWSAAASILAFIPTIVGLLSNSIDEIVAVADESLLLALSLALSSTVSFSSRFTSSEASPMNEYDAAYVAAAKGRIVNVVSREVHRIERSHSRKWFRTDRFWIGCAVIALAVCAAAIWYCVWRLTRYGCVVWSCSAKFHTALWVALSQVLVVLSIAARSISYKVRTINLQGIHRDLFPNTPMLPNTHSIPRKPVPQQAPLLGSDLSRISIVLRCRQGGWQRWVVQTASSVISYGLYAFSTVVLASMALIWPVDAVLIMLAFSVAGGVGRLVGYWAKSSLRRGKTVVCFDIPEMHMRELEEQLNNQVDWRNLGIEMRSTG